MISFEKLQAQFKTFDISIPNSLLDLCTELCLTYDLDEESLVDSWIAWTFSSDLTGAVPTKELLNNFERLELSKVKPKSNLVLTTPKNKKEERQTYSPSHVGQYSSRSNSGRTVVTYGKSSFSWSSVDQEIIFNFYEKNPNSTDWKFFYNTLRSWKLLSDEVDQNLASFLLEKHALPEPSPFTILSEPAIFVAKICPVDKAVVAESNLVTVEDICGDLDSLGRVQMDISSFSDFAIFPGQVVAIQGNIVGTVLVPSKIIDNAALPLAPSPKLEKHLQMIVANGPFTICDPFNYDPLTDLLKIVKEQKPNVLMLIGPILDLSFFENSLDPNLLSMDDYMNKIFNYIEEELKDLSIKIFVIASHKDITELPVYPTPALELFSCKKIEFLCDPSFITLNEIAIGVTATDSLLHIAKNDISEFGSLSGHLIRQQSFYPLRPVEIEGSFNSFLWYEYARFTATPHIIFTASELNYFVKEVEQCIVINPGKLCKGTAGGTYACVEIRPPHEDGTWVPNSCISAKIIKI